MSLKAKIEAVIYASEEPVTLAQLVGLLGQEGQAELDRLEDRQGSLGLDGDGAASEDSGASGEEEGAPEEGGFPHRTQEDDAEDAKGESGGDVPLGGAESAAAVEAVTAVELPAPVSKMPLTGDPVRSIPHPFDEAERMGHPEQATADSSASLRNDNKNAPRNDNQVGAGEKKAAKEKERKLREFFQEILDGLMKEYATGDRGVEVREVAGGFRMATKPEYHDAVRGFVRSLKPVLKLSQQALETLAVVAYKQPVTAPEVSEIRGVDSGGVLGSLMGRKLVTTAGRKQVIGRPILYKTTKDFLLRFGLKDIGELPSIEEFEKLAGEMAEQEEIPMSEENEAQERVMAANLEEEKDATEPQADGDSEELDEAMPVDGRISGVPPNYEKPGDDPSADEAAIQEQGS